MESAVWRAQTATRGGGPPRGGRRPRPSNAPADEEIGGLAEDLADRVRQLVERDYPALWEALTQYGRELFTRSIIEAASRPPEDRVPAIRKAIQAWLEAWTLRSTAPVDDEPVTDEERREVEEEKERLRRGEGVPLR